MKLSGVCNIINRFSLLVGSMSRAILNEAKQALKKIIYQIPIV